MLKCSKITGVTKFFFRSWFAWRASWLMLLPERPSSAPTLSSASMTCRVFKTTALLFSNNLILINWVLLRPKVFCSSSTDRCSVSLKRTSILNVRLPSFKAGRPPLLGSLVIRKRGPMLNSPPGVRRTGGTSVLWLQNPSGLLSDKCTSCSDKIQNITMELAMDF